MLAGPGALYAQLNTYISPDIFTFNSALIVLTMVLVGGMGSLPGSVVGTVLLLVLNEYLQVFARWQLVGYGVAIIVVVLCPPRRSGRTRTSIRKFSPALVNWADEREISRGGWIRCSLK